MLKSTITVLFVITVVAFYGSIDATIERAKKLIPHIHVEIIPNAGHLPNMDQPNLVNKMILKFLAE
jgi:pimeloyl-ACP methyl ester carboxylesterase